MEAYQDKSEIKALIRMIDEPDMTVYKKIKNKIISYGTDIIPILEHEWENTFNDFFQSRIEDIIHELHFENLYIELSAWAMLNSDDLEKAFILITKYQYPDLNEKKILFQLNRLKRDVWLEMNENLTALEKVRIINHILYEVYSFKSNKSNINSPQNNFLKDLLETRKGNAVSLGILYMLIAKHLNLPIGGVNLPNNFILAYAGLLTEGIYSISDDRHILFYINPLNAGAVFTKKEIELFLKEMKLAEDPSFYKTCDNIAIIRRLLNELLSAYEKLGYKNKSEEIKRLLKALS